MKTDDQTLINLLWSKFSHEEIGNQKRIPLGFKNKSYYIETQNDQKFVLKVYAPRFLTKEQVEERATITNYCNEQNLPVVKLVRGLDGSYAQEVEYDGVRYYATLSKFVDLQFPETNVNKEVIKNIAKELRRLHNTLSSFHYSSDFKKLRSDYINIFLSDQVLDPIKKHFAEKDGRSARLEEFLSFYLHEGNKLKEYFESTDLFKSIQLNHGDFILNNIYIENQKVITIFDFDEMVLAPKAWDIALCIYSLDYPEEFYVDELLQIFIEAYFDRNEITKDLVFDIVTIMRYRAFNRIARYFTDFQFKENPGGYFTKFQGHLEKFNQIDVDEVYKLIKG